VKMIFAVHLIPAPSLFAMHKGYDEKFGRFLARIDMMSHVLKK